MFGGGDERKSTIPVPELDRFCVWSGGRDTAIDQPDYLIGRGLGVVNCSADCFDRCKGALDAGRLRK